MLLPVNRYPIVRLVVSGVLENIAITFVYLAIYLHPDLMLKYPSRLVNIFVITRNVNRKFLLNGS